MKIFGLEIQASKNVYSPREDTHLLAENLREEIEEEERVLDVGTGTGLLALVAAEKASEVIGVDLSEEAVKLARENAEGNSIENTKFLRSDLFENIPEERFDLIVFNPPYLPGIQKEEEIENHKQWYGGESGREAIKKFASEVGKYLVEEGRILLVISSVTELESTMDIFEEEGFGVEVGEKRKIPWETLYLLKVRRT